MSWFHWKKRNDHRIRQISSNWIIMWDTMLGCYQKYMPKPSNIAELKTALLSIWNNLPQEFIDKATRHFERDFDRALLQLVDILTQVKYRDGSWNSSLKRRKCWQKSCAKFDLFLLNIHACLLEKVNFKL